MWDTQLAKSKNAKLGNPKIMLLCNHYLVPSPSALKRCPAQPISTMTEQDLQPQPSMSGRSFCHFSPDLFHILSEARGLQAVTRQYNALMYIIATFHKHFPTSGYLLLPSFNFSHRFLGLLDFTVIPWRIFKKLTEKKKIGLTVCFYLLFLSNILGKKENI